MTTKTIILTCFFSIFHFCHSEASIYKIATTKKFEEQFFSPRSDEKKLSGEGILSTNTDRFKVTIRSHGSSDSPGYIRKSIEIKASKSIVIRGIKSKHFIFLSFPEDIFFVNDYVARSFLIKTKLAFSQGEYVWLKFNDSEPMLYLLTPDPVGVFKKLNPDITYILRSRHENQLSQVAPSSPLLPKNYKVSLDSFITQNISDPQLYQKLKKLINIDKYLEWLSLNRILRNCDYEDELYWGITRTHITGNLYVKYFYGWDFEQIMCKAPYEEGRSLLNKRGFLFSEKGILARAIISNKSLFNRYLKVLESTLLKHFSPIEVNQHFESTKFTLKSKYSEVKNPTNKSISPTDVFNYLNALERMINREVADLLLLLWDERY